jgi:beta-glucanase (GH16 family)
VRQWIRAPVVVAIVTLAAIASACGASNSAEGSRPSTATRTPSTQVSGPTKGMHLTFADGFDGPTLDTSRWDTCYWWSDQGAGCTIFGYNGEQEWYLPSQAQVSGGALHLVASREATSGVDVNGNPQLYPWRSGVVTTFRSYAFTYGYVAVRARVPKGAGLWTTLWLLPQDKSGPPEVDIAEIFGWDPMTLNTTYHRPGDTSTSGSPSRATSTTDLSAAFHDYALDWEPNSLTWYLDGKPVFHLNTSPSQPMYFLANLAVADLLGVAPNALTPSPASLDIQNVAIYQR